MFVRVIDRRVVLTLGDDGKDTNALKEEVKKHIQHGLQKFEFDLSRLQSVNTTGLGMIAAAVEKIKEQNCAVTITNVNSSISSFLNMTGLEQYRK